MENSTIVQYAFIMGGSRGGGGGAIYFLRKTGADPTLGPIASREESSARPSVKYVDV